MQELKRYLGAKSKGPREVLSFLRRDGGKELDVHNDSNGKGFATTALTLWSESRKYGTVFHVERGEDGTKVECTVFGPGASHAAKRLNHLLRRLS
jgi:hypothetical protein